MAERKNDNPDKSDDPFALEQKSQAMALSVAEVPHQQWHYSDTGRQDIRRAEVKAAYRHGYQARPHPSRVYTLPIATLEVDPQLEMGNDGFGSLDYSRNMIQYRNSMSIPRMCNGYCKYSHAPCMYAGRGS